MREPPPLTTADMSQKIASLEAELTGLLDLHGLFLIDVGMEVTRLRAEHTRLEQREVEAQKLFEWIACVEPEHTPLGAAVRQWLQG